VTNAYDSSLYGQRAAAVYDEDTPACDERMIDALATLAGRWRALELGIGTGRVALPLAARGVPVEGVDISPAMVDGLRAKPGGADIRVTMGSFADVPVAGRFELVYVVFNTFYMLLTQDEQARCFQRVAGRLRPGGSFVVEGFLLDKGDHADVRRGGTDRLPGSSHSDRATQRITLEYAGMGIGGTRQYPLELRVASPAELDRMARLAGLRLSARWADWGAEPFGELATSHVSIYTG
jgi:SAM-dependent methyltransferase